MNPLKYYDNAIRRAHQKRKNEQKDSIKEGLKARLDQLAKDTDVARTSRLAWIDERYQQLHSLEKFECELRNKLNSGEIISKWEIEFLLDEHPEAKAIINGQTTSTKYLRG